MAKSIADQILQELKKEKEDNIKKKQKECLDYIRNTLYKMLSPNFEKLRETKMYTFDIHAIPFSRESFIHTALSLGFQDIDNNVASPPEEVRLIIPYYEKGKKKTPAQLMIYSFNVEMNKRIKEAKRQACEERKKVWASLKNRDFEFDDKNDGTFIIIIPLSKERGGNLGDQELRDFLLLRNFPNFIENDILFITLGEKND